MTDTYKPTLQFFFAASRKKSINERLIEITKILDQKSVKSEGSHIFVENKAVIVEFCCLIILKKLLNRVSKEFSKGLADKIEDCAWEIAFDLNAKIALCASFLFLFNDLTKGRLVKEVRYLAESISPHIHI